MKHIIISIVLIGCTVQTVPVVPPPDGPGTCETACQRLQELGGCGVRVDTCPEDCRAAREAEEGVGVRFPVGCLTAVSSCAEAERCQ